MKNFRVNAIFFIFLFISMVTFEWEVQEYRFRPSSRPDQETISIEKLKVLLLRLTIETESWSSE